MEALTPELSRSAMRMNKKKLQSVPWNHEGEHPGSFVIWKLFRAMVIFGHKAIFRRSKSDNVPEIDGGRISVSTHINGLVDPLVIVNSQERRFTALGRHDLVTRPLLGWWCRGLGIQPILRRVEMAEGVTDSEFARFINQRSMLTVSNCISTGHSAVVFPEGTSHQDSLLHGFKTGPFRTVFAASAIAEIRNLPLPHLQPTGLHWRNHTRFRTDHYVEYLDPIPIPNPYDEKEAKELISGKWVEPPEKAVISMRDRVYQILKEITPDAPDWDTYRSWALIANRSRKDEKLDLHEEVIETRKVREIWRQGKLNQDLMDNARISSKLLFENGLDGRDIDQNGRLKREDGALLNLFLGASIIFVSSPLCVLGTFPQAFIAWWLGDRTDEGIDARTTYHLLAAMFSIPIFWPLFSIIWTLLAINVVGIEAIYAPIIFAILLPAFYIATLTTAYGYDLTQDFLRNRRRMKLSRKDDSVKLYNSIIHIDKHLVDLI